MVERLKSFGSPLREAKDTLVEARRRLHAANLGIHQGRQSICGQVINNALRTEVSSELSRKIQPGSDLSFSALNFNLFGTLLAHPVIAAHLIESNEDGAEQPKRIQCHEERESLLLNCYLR